MPDDKFEQKLIDLDFDAGALDDYVFTSNISTVTHLSLFNLGISDLTGIEKFTALTSLDCRNNQLTSLDVSANTTLTSLYCSSNQLTNFDVSANTVLTSLDCRNNQLTSLDVSANTTLTSLACSSNQLTNFDVSANTALTSLDCPFNQLTRLNVKNGNNINFGTGGFYAYGNPNLRCIQVDNAEWSTNNWTDIDGTTSFSEDCNSLDIDNDGVTDDMDQCTNTPRNEVANAMGCSPSQINTDGDGVFDDVDQCTNTPRNEVANAMGCSPSEMDTDGDGVVDDVDQCTNTPRNEVANAMGCSPSEMDTDGDGVFDDLDQCTTTPSGSTVDAIGCYVVKSSLNYCNTTVLGNSEYISNVSFAGVNHESVGFSAGGYSNHTELVAVVNAELSYGFSVTRSREDANTQTEVWIDWNQDGDFGDANENVLSLQGVIRFGEINVPVSAHVLNGITRMRVRYGNNDAGLLQACGEDASFGEVEDYSVLVAGGTDNVVLNINGVSPDAPSNVKFYPHPTVDLLHIAELESSDITVQVFSYNGQQVYTENHKSVNGIFQVSMRGLSAGLYVVKVYGKQDGYNIRFKITKQ